MDQPTNPFEVLRPDESAAAARRRVEIEQARAESLRRAWDAALNSPQMMLVIEDILGEAKPLTASFTGHFASTSFNEGRRAVGQHILNRIQWANPAVFANWLMSRSRDENRGDRNG